MSQPRASAQGTFTLSILTLPDSVRRSPTWFQLCWEIVVSFLASSEERHKSHGKLDPRLLGGNHGKDVVLGSFKDTFENSEI